MIMNETTDTRDPAEIERDIRATQDEMSRTVDRIGGQLTPRNLINSLLDQAESHNIDARTLLDGARRNPIALAMIAGGAIWLVSDADAKLPSNMPSLGNGKSPEPAEAGDTHHRDYVAHMERVEWRDGEDPLAYQRRRDIARANFLMCERGHDEDEPSFRERLDDLTDKFRQKRQAWSDQGSRATASAGGAARSAAASAGDTARSAATRAQDLFIGNPLIGGLAAAAVGAILGTVIPITETEEQKLSGLGEKARDLASEQKDKLADAAREKKDSLVEKVDQSVSAQPSGGQLGSGRVAATP
jgi:hypothetical protein